MQLDKPKSIDRTVYVTFTDKVTRKSVAMPIYETTKEEAMETFKRYLAGVRRRVSEAPARKESEAATSAAS